MGFSLGNEFPALFEPQFPEVAFENRQREHELTIIDGLYGPCEHSEEDWRLVSSGVICDLAHHSQASVPDILSHTETTCTTRSHALGTAHLAKIVLEQPEFRTLCPELFPAALCHDLGGGPFRHVSDHYMLQILGVDHEGRLEEKLPNTTFGKIALEQGYDLNKIISCCQDDKTASTIGSQILNFIDSLDNVLRYSQSRGLINASLLSHYPGFIINPLPQDINYSPVAIAAALRWHDGQICLQKSAVPDLRKYWDCREYMYAHIGNHPNRASESMLHRAIDLAFEQGHITPDFFDYSDEKAFDYLSNCCTESQNILLRAKSGERYTNKYFGSMVTHTEEDGANQIPPSHDGFIRDPLSCRKTADGIAKMLGVSRDQVCVYIQPGDSSYRPCRFPIINNDGILRETPKPNYHLKWQYQVAVYIGKEATTAQIQHIENYVDSSMRNYPNPVLPTRNFSVIS